MLTGVGGPAKAACEGEDVGEGSGIGCPVGICLISRNLPPAPIRRLSSHRTRCPSDSVSLVSSTVRARSSLSSLVVSFDAVSCSIRLARQSSCLSTGSPLHKLHPPFRKPYIAVVAYRTAQ